LFAGYAFHPDLPMDAAAAVGEVVAVRDTFLGSKLAVAVGSLLMIPLVLAVRRRLVPGRGSGLATVAAVLVTVGMASNALSQATHGYLLWFASAPTVDQAAGAAVVEASVTSQSLATLPVSFLSVPVFAVGLLLLAASLWRAGSVPRWVPVAIVLVDVAAGAIGVGLLMLVVGAVATAAFGTALFAAPRTFPVAT
jgi:hypothetical protein